MGSAEKAINNTTHQEKYKKYNLKVQKREKDFTKSNIYNISQPVYCHRKE